jgi:uncharacterized membrane protein YidH (DUF202 family)
VPAEKPVDRGLVHERTDLAWNRSGLAVVACTGVLLRRIWPLHGTDQIVALVGISTGAFAWALALTVGRAASGRAAGGRRTLGIRRAGAITAGTLALAVTALVLAFFPPS